MKWDNDRIQKNQYGNEGQGNSIGMEKIIILTTRMIGFLLKVFFKLKQEKLLMEIIDNGWILKEILLGAGIGEDVLEEKLEALIGMISIVVMV